MASLRSPTLSVAIIGGGLGGLCAAISLRRAGHAVTIYERHFSFSESGAGIGIPSNGSKRLEKWDVDIEAGKPVIMDKLIIRKWDTGDVIATAPLGNYEEKFRYNMLGFQRCDLHRILLEKALEEGGIGTPAKLVTGYVVNGVDAESGRVTFENGEEIIADFVIAADRIHSRLRSAIGISPQVKQASACAYRHIIPTSKIRELGLGDIGSKEALEFWMGPGTNKIVIGSYHGGDTLGIYSFFPIDSEKQEKDGWDISRTPEQLVATFPNLDPRIHQLMLHSQDIKIWCLYIHKPYPYWNQGRVALLGDAAHPMLPDQIRGTTPYFGVNDGKGNEEAIGRALKRYEKSRVKRAGELQGASAKARADMRERIGWKAEGEREGKLAIEDLCGYDMEGHLGEIVAMENES